MLRRVCWAPHKPSIGFGDVYIAIPKMEHDVVLRDVINPAVQLQDIQARMAERASGTSSLIN
jgi:hypothetical protein